MLPVFELADCLIEILKHGSIEMETEDGFFVARVSVGSGDTFRRAEGRSPKLLVDAVKNAMIQVGLEP